MGVAKWTKGDAQLSPCGQYRYWLTRQWAEGDNLVAFLGLNPSKATAEVDDHTIRRCIGFARHWGYDGFLMVNVFAFRATRPTDLYSAEDPIGPENDDTLLTYLRGRNLVVCWGGFKFVESRLPQLAEIFRRVKVRPKCFGLSVSGHPLHPLRLSNDMALRPYDIQTHLRKLTK